MFYENWMTTIKDDAKINKIAIPAAHNACTKGMVFMGRCQNGTVLQQYRYGVREFGVRLSARRNKLYISHGITTGMTADEAFRTFGEIVDNYDDFFILDIRTYPGQKVGPFSLSYDCNPDDVNELIDKYLNPGKYALTDCDSVKDLTIGDIRKSGKKYIILNANKEYKYSSDVELLEPWDPVVFGLKPEKFAKEAVNYLRELNTEGFFWYQTQQTPNPGTENGMKWPNKLDIEDRLYFPQMMNEIASDPALVEKLNIVAGDFMTADHMKSNIILYFNILKDIVKPECKDYYLKSIGKAAV